MNRYRHERNVSEILNRDPSNKVLETMHYMNQVGIINRKYRGNVAAKRNDSIVQENKRLMINLGKIMTGTDYNAKRRNIVMPRPENIGLNKSLQKPKKSHKRSDTILEQMNSRIEEIKQNG